VLEHHRRVAPLPVTVLDMEADLGGEGEVRTVEGVGRVRRIVQLDEPVGVLHGPAGIETGVVRDHVTGQADPPLAAALFQVTERLFPPQVVGDDVVVEGVGGRDGIGVAGDLLDLLGSGRALPESDEPEGGEPPAGEDVQFLVRHLVEAVDGALVLAGELVEPDVGHLGEHHHVGHPVGIGGEPFVLRVVESPLAELSPFQEFQHIGPSRLAAGGEHLPLFRQHGKGSRQLSHQFRREHIGPPGPDILHLPLKRVGERLGGGTQKFGEGEGKGSNRPPLGQFPLQGGNRRPVRAPRLQLVVVQHNPERRQGGIFDGGTEEEQLLDTELLPAVAGGVTRQPGGRVGDGPVQDVAAGEAVAETLQQPGKFRRPAGEAGGRQRIFQQGRLPLLGVNIGQVPQGLHVEGIEIEKSRLDRLAGIVAQSFGQTAEEHDPGHPPPLDLPYRVIKFQKPPQVAPDLDVIGEIAQPFAGSVHHALECSCCME